MPEYYVGCGVFGIYAGTLNSKNKSLWQSKTECANEVIDSVEYLKDNELNVCPIVR